MLISLTSYFTVTRLIPVRTRTRSCGRGEGGSFGGLRMVVCVCWKAEVAEEAEVAAAGGTAAAMEAVLEGGGLWMASRRKKCNR